jgi:hypothetical protein
MLLICPHPVRRSKRALIVMPLISNVIILVATRGRTATAAAAEIGSSLILAHPLPP